MEMFPVPKHHPIKVVGAMEVKLLVYLTRHCFEVSGHLHALIAIFSGKVRPLSVR